MIESDDRRLLLTAAWIFARHGQDARARTMCEALVEDNPRDGVSAVALADLLLESGEAAEALTVLRRAECPAGLERAEALLETRALRLTGRDAEADRRWKRHLVSQNRNRKWVAQA